MAKYAPDKVDYSAVYFAIQPDRAIQPAFDPKTGKVKLDADGVPVIAQTLTLVKVGTMREPSGKVDRPVFQTDQTHAYTDADLARFLKCTSAVDVRTVENGIAKPPAAKVAGF